jgi:hypothetical protein
LTREQESSDGDKETKQNHLAASPPFGVPDSVGAYPTKPNADTPDAAKNLAESGLKRYVLPYSVTAFNIRHGARPKMIRNSSIP